MRELPNDRSDFARQQGVPAGHKEKAGGIPYPRATNRASRLQTRKRNTRPHSQSEVDDGETQGKPETCTCALSTTRRPSIVSTMKDCG